MFFFFMNNIGYIFIVRRLGKQSKLILSRSDSISNLKIHGPCGPNAHAGADLQAFLIFCFKPILLSAHKLILLIYDDNTIKSQICQVLFRNYQIKTSVFYIFKSPKVIRSRLISTLPNRCQICQFCFIVPIIEMIMQLTF